MTTQHADPIVQVVGRNKEIVRGTLACWSADRDGRRQPDQPNTARNYPFPKSHDRQKKRLTLDDREIAGLGLFLWWRLKLQLEGFDLVRTQIKLERVIISFQPTTCV